MELKSNTLAHVFWLMAAGLGLCGTCAAEPDEELLGYTERY
jgi:hypothetical protein